MASLVGQTFPENVTFQYVPYSPEKADLNACGIPIKFDASKGEVPSAFENKVSSLRPEVLD